MAAVVQKSWAAPGGASLHSSGNAERRRLSSAAAAKSPASCALKSTAAPAHPSNPALRRRAAGAVAVAAEASTEPAGEEQSGKQARPSLAEFAKTVMELAEEGSLCTHHKGQGAPLGTHVAYVLDTLGRPVLCLPSHSVALADLKEDSQCSLHVQVELPGLQKPQVTICGKAAPPADAASAMRLELAWSRKYGEDTSAAAGTEGAPCLWMLSIDRLLVAADVDQSPSWISAEEYLEADADPLRDVARKIVEDVNREHWQDLGHFCHVYGGLEDEIEDASMTWVDRLGFDLRVWLRTGDNTPPSVRELRIPFSREAADEREARSSITMMAQVAWEKERNYTPVMPSLVPTPLTEQ